MLLIYPREHACLSIYVKQLAEATFMDIAHCEPMRVRDPFAQARCARKGRQLTGNPSTSFEGSCECLCFRRPPGIRNISSLWCHAPPAQLGIAWPSQPGQLAGPNPAKPARSDPHHHHIITNARCGSLGQLTFQMQTDKTAASEGRNKRNK